MPIITNSAKFSMTLPVTVALAHHKHFSFTVGFSCTTKFTGSFIYTGFQFFQEFLIAVGDIAGNDRYVYLGFCD
jgi:hypothetical protein